MYFARAGISKQASIQRGVLPIRLPVQHYAHLGVNSLTATDYVAGQTPDLDSSMSLSVHLGATPPHQVHMIQPIQ